VALALGALALVALILPCAHLRLNSYLSGYTKCDENQHDSTKRAQTLEERGLDFRDAGLVFAGRTAPYLTSEGLRRRALHHGHATCAGLVVLVWTQRGNTRRIISMRHGHAKEAKAWAAHLD
jgi:uncharacterized DUF497 family protein